MKRMSLVLSFAVALISSALCGCRTVTIFRDGDMQRFRVGAVAVLPFENESSSPEAGRVVSELLSMELRSRLDWSIVPDHEVRDSLGEEEMKPGTPRHYREIGEQLNVGTLVTGVVNEYRYRRSLGEAPAVGIAVRIIDVTSGDLIWGAAIADEGHCFLTYHGSLSLLSHKLCRNLARRLKRDLTRSGL